MKLTIIKLFLILATISFEDVRSEERVKLDFKSSRSAIRFIEKWLSGPDLIVNIILPDISRFYTNDIVKLTKIISYNFENRPYISFDFNQTKNGYVVTNEKEIYWYPFQSNLYDISVLCPDFILPNETQQKHVLYYTEAEQNVNKLFRLCGLRYDSNIAHYYKVNNAAYSNNFVFEEIFKIDENGENLEKNVLAKFNPKSKELETKGLSKYIWKRRNTLHGINFKSLMDLMPPYVTHIKKNVDVNGESVLHPVGYYADLISHLMSKLNFTLTNNMNKRRYDTKLLVNLISQGKYDIGITTFIQNRQRKDRVDFSFGIGSQTVSLYYVKHYKEPNFSAFIESFQSEAWCALVLYTFILICGYVTFNWMLEERHDRRSMTRIFCSFQNAVNFVLRSIIGKRISLEPDWISKKLGFFVLTFAGFVFITLYRAMLVAFIAVDVENAPIKSFDEIRTSDYRLAVSKNTAMDNTFIYAKPRSEEEKLNQTGKILRYQGGVRNFMDEMTSNEKLHGKVILFDVQEFVKFSEHTIAQGLQTQDFDQTASTQKRG